MKKVALREAQGVYELAIDDETLAHEKIVLERDGQPVAVVVPIGEYEALRDRPGVRQESEPEPASLVRNRTAFLSMKEQLLESHLGQYVAFKDGEFVDADPDETALVLRLYDRFGVVPLYVKKVEAQEQVYWIRSPRIAR